MASDLSRSKAMPFTQNETCKASMQLVKLWRSGVKLDGNREIQRVSKNVPPLACCNFDTHAWILIFFDRRVTDKVGNQKTPYYATSDN